MQLGALEQEEKLPQTAVGITGNEGGAAKK